MRSSNIGHIPAVDQLRGVAVLLVLYYHAFQLLGHHLRFGGEGFSLNEWVTAKNPFLAVIVEGHCAVALFMVLSGFIFTCGAIDREVLFRPFIANRFRRIAPMAIFMVVCGASAHFGESDFLTLLRSVFLSFDPAATKAPRAFVGVTWTIAIEFQFYFVFPFLIAFYRKKGIGYLVALEAVFLLFRALASLDSKLPRDLAYWTILGHMDQFLFGMMAAVVYIRRSSWQRVLAFFFPLAAAAVVAWLALFNQRGGWPVAGNLPVLWPTIDALVFSLLLLTYLPASKWIPKALARPLQGAGTVSFSAYLLHYPVITLLARSDYVLHLKEGTWQDATLLSTSLIALPIVFALSSLTYFTIEKPFLDLRQIYLKPPQ